MTLPDDHELRARFHRLRDEDGAHVPPFRLLLARISSGVPRRAGAMSALWMSAAAAAVLAVGFALGLGDGRHAGQLADDARFSDDAAVTGTTAWTSPTASLLRSPSRELTAPPPILSSVLDGLTRPLDHRTGDR